jgi:hypothetical protein
MFKFVFSFGQIKPIPNKPSTTTKKTIDGFALPLMPAPSSRQKNKNDSKNEGLFYIIPTLLIFSPKAAGGTIAAFFHAHAVKIG